METLCRCSKPILHADDKLGCIQCGRACCRACGVALESVIYCALCAAALLGAPAALPIGALTVSV
jgi:hypothetical protein